MYRFYNDNRVLTGDIVSCLAGLIDIVFQGRQ